MTDQTIKTKAFDSQNIEIESLVTIVRYGVQWSNDGRQWLAIVTDKTLDEAKRNFKLNTAKYKRLVKHEIVKTILQSN